MPTFGSWLKSDHLTDHEDDGIVAVFDNISGPKHAPSPTSSSHAAQLSLEVNSSLLNAIHSLRNDVRGLQEEVRSHREDINS